MPTTAIITERFDQAGHLLYRMRSSIDPMELVGCVHCKGGGTEWRALWWGEYLWAACCVCLGRGYFRADSSPPGDCGR